MAAVYDGGVILGADSRTTGGALIYNRVSDKIEPIDRRIFCLRSGTSAHTQKIAQITRLYMSQLGAEMQQPVPVYSAAKTMQYYIYNYKSFLSAAMICAGWDPYKGPQIYTLPLGGTMVEEKIATGGSGSVYMSGFCDTHFKTGMTRKECRDFVVSAISLAMYRDSSSGGIIRLVDISKESVTREYITRDQLPIK